MRYLKIAGSLILVLVLFQSCMMPFGMGGMHGNMNQSMMNKSADFMLKLNSTNGNYTQSLLTLVQDEGNSKFFIKTENTKTHEFISNYKSSFNIYRIPYRNANLKDIKRAIIGENINFTNIPDGEQYVSFPSLSEGDYWIRVDISSINNKRLNVPLSFNYKFNYNNSMMKSDNSLLGVNYWIWGAAMGAVMTAFMLVAH